MFPEDEALGAVGVGALVCSVLPGLTVPVGVLMSRVLGAGGGSPWCNPASPSLAQSRAFSPALLAGVAILRAVPTRGGRAVAPALMSWVQRFLSPVNVGWGFPLPGGISCCCFSEKLGIEGKAPKGFTALSHLVDCLSPNQATCLF